MAAGWIGGCTCALCLLLHRAADHGADKECLAALSRARVCRHSAHRNPGKLGSQFRFFHPRLSIPAHETYGTGLDGLIAQEAVEEATRQAVQESTVRT